MPAALTLTKASPAAREGFGTCSSLSTDSMTPFCANRRAFMAVLSIEGGKRELTPWFYIVEFTLGLLPGSLASRFREITCTLSRSRISCRHTKQGPSSANSLHRNPQTSEKTVGIILIIISLITEADLTKGCIVISPGPRFVRSTLS